MTALETTSVGSLPKPDYLVRARARASRGELQPDPQRARILGMVLDPEPEIAAELQHRIIAAQHIAEERADAALARSSRCRRSRSIRSSRG